VDSSESSRLGTLLGLGRARAVGTLGAGENAAGSNDQDVAVRELLLELTGEALLGLVPVGEKGNWDEDDNSLASVANLDLRILVSALVAAQCPPPLRICRVWVCVQATLESAS
jgi:hypothetical protein